MIYHIVWNIFIISNISGQDELLDFDMKIKFVDSTQGMEERDPNHVDYVEKETRETLCFLPIIMMNRCESYQNCES